MRRKNYDIAKYVMDKLGLIRTTYYKLVNEFDTRTWRFENREYRAVAICCGSFLCLKVLVNHKFANLADKLLAMKKYFSSV